MVTLTVEQVRALMGHPEQIRHMFVLAHVDHGRRTVTDMLAGAAGIAKEEDFTDRCFYDTRDEMVSMLLKPTAIAMHFSSGEKDGPSSGQPRISPGNVDFSAGALVPIFRVADGALVVVDCIDGVCVQTETVLRLALTERIRPVVFINKVDRAMIELQLEPEETYQAIVKLLDDINNVIATHSDPCMGDLQVSPLRGTVVFGSGLQAWAFSVTRFARMYASKFGVDEAKMCERLWGDSFFDVKNKKWICTELNQDGDRLKRAFCQFCLDPIYQIFDAALTEKKDKMEKMLKALNIVLTQEERDQVPKKLLKTVMMKFLPAAETLLQMIALHLPSPKKAQTYRAEMLYSGEPKEEDKYFIGIKNCDQTAPLMLNISKMVPTADKSRFFAFGRIFSGNVRSGQKVRIMGNNYSHNDRDAEKTPDLLEDKPVQRAVVVMGRYGYAVDDIPCGNLCCLVGLERCIGECATISDSGEGPYPLRAMNDGSM